MRDLNEILDFISQIPKLMGRLGMHPDDTDPLQDIRHIVYEWKAYKDLEEQNRLLKLPCAVGDTVYVVEVDEENFDRFHCQGKIVEYKFCPELIELIGKCVFLTREEAESVLREPTEKG